MSYAVYAMPLRSGARDPAFQGAWSGTLFVVVVRFLTQPFTARTWKETLYLLLSMPVGILTFVVMITGLTTGRRACPMRASPGNS